MAPGSWKTSQQALLCLALKVVEDGDNEGTSWPSQVRKDTDSLKNFEVSGNDIDSIE